MPDLSVLVHGLGKEANTVVTVSLEELGSRTSLGGLLSHIESKLGCKAWRIKADALREVDDTSPVDQSIRNLLVFTPPLQVITLHRHGAL
jgi:hypothetical protein